MTRLLITGASGFIGTQMVSTWQKDFEIFTTKLRTSNVDSVELDNVDSVVFLTGIAHQSKETPSSLYFEVNTDLAVTFAKKAKNKGVRQFIYFSSAKVYGEFGSFNESSKCNPMDSYGQSKLKAEQALTLLSDSSFKVMIIRPPLIVGPSAKGNLIKLMKLVEKGWPLPFGKINNKRSMIGIDNLLLFTKMAIEKNAKGIYNIAEKTDISTSSLVRMIGRKLDVKLNLFAIPLMIRKVLFSITPSKMNRLFGDFSLDCNDSFSRIGFTPEGSIENAISKMVRDYKEQK